MAAPRRRVRAGPGEPGPADASTRRSAAARSSPWKSPDGQASGRHPHLSGRVPDGHARAAAGRRARRADRRVRQQLPRGGEPVPDGGLRGRGYAVLRVNPRGSSGYGRTFRYANLADWGGGDYLDIMAGVDHVIGHGRRRPRSARRDGLELRRVHDVVDRDADAALQGRLGRRRSHAPGQLHGHGRHPRLHPRLLQGRVLGGVRQLARALAACST